MNQDLRIRELINRLARLDTTQAWQGDLNPTQNAVLDYLGRANRFSKSPSHVADYLGTTRGTISQSLKSLGQKGYVTEERSATDKRTIRFELTSKGIKAALAPNLMANAVANMPEMSSDALIAALEALLLALLKANSGKAFGICNACTHFVPRQNGGYCALLSEDLSETDATQICHEQVSM
ncbi:MAG: MarR family transcriptional regulator [Paracoccaceae bacterium]